MITNNELKALGFMLTHEILLLTQGSSLPEFREIGAQHASLTKSSVYLWLSPAPVKPGSYEVLYVGKSGKVAPNAWFLRIPQPTSKTSGLTLFIPQCFAAAKLNHAKVVSHGTSSHAFFYPLDVDHFLLHSEEYVDWTRTDTRSVQRKIRR